jgi:hypothetical protein
MIGICVGLPAMWVRLPPGAQGPTTAIGTAAALLGIFMLLSLRIYPWKYSVFGEIERTPFPEGGASLSVRGVPVIIGNCSLRGATMCLFASGLGIELFGGISRTFIPASELRSVVRNDVGWASVRHTSPEIRSPIIFKSEALYAALDLGLQHARAAAALDRATSQS